MLRNRRFSLIRHYDNPERGLSGQKRDLDPAVIGPRGFTKIRDRIRHTANRTNASVFIKKCISFPEMAMKFVFFLILYEKYPNF